MRWTFIIICCVFAFFIAVLRHWGLRRLFLLRTVWTNALLERIRQQLSGRIECFVELDKYFSRAYFQKNEIILNSFAKLVHAKTQESVKVIVTETGENPDDMVDVDPRYRARADIVEVIEHIVDEKDSAQHLLERYLLDSDNRVRANAIKALARYNPQRAAVLLEEMSLSRDSWARMSAAWACGEAANPLAGEILLRLVYDENTLVRKRAFMSVKRMLALHFNLPEQLRRRLQEALASV